MFENEKNLDESAKSSLSMTYEGALDELKEVLKVVDSQGTSLDDLLTHVQRANQLVQHCKTKLRTIEEDVNQIL